LHNNNSLRVIWNKTLRLVFRSSSLCTTVISLSNKVYIHSNFKILENFDMFRAYEPVIRKHYWIVFAILLVATSNMCDILKTKIKSNYTSKFGIILRLDTRYPYTYWILWCSDVTLCIGICICTYIVIGLYVKFSMCLLCVYWCTVSCFTLNTFM
jgi:hypothetical protein